MHFRLKIKLRWITPILWRKLRFLRKVHLISSGSLLFILYTFFGFQVYCHCLTTLLLGVTILWSNFQGLQPTVIAFNFWISEDFQLSCTFKRMHLHLQNSEKYEFLTSKLMPNYSLLVNLTLGDICHSLNPFC